MTYCSAARGESKLHPLVAARLLKEVREQDESLLKDLTPRELEVLAQIAHGRSNAEIAAELIISEPTVRMHVANILMKLHLADRTQAAIFALQKKLVLSRMRCPKMRKNKRSIMLLLILERYTLECGRAPAPNQTLYP